MWGNPHRFDASLFETLKSCGFRSSFFVSGWDGIYLASRDMFRGLQ